jgi:hypothetical protein
VLGGTSERCAASGKKTAAPLDVSLHDILASGHLNAGWNGIEHNDLPPNKTK